MRALIIQESDKYIVFIDDGPEDSVEIECKGHDEALDLLEAIKRDATYIVTDEKIQEMETRLNTVIENQESCPIAPDPRRGYRKFV